MAGPLKTDQIFFCRFPYAKLEKFSAPKGVFIADKLYVRLFYLATPHEKSQVLEAKSEEEICKTANLYVF